MRIAVLAAVRSPVRARARRAGTMLLLGAALAAAGCRSEPPVPRNVVLIVVDTLRADALGVHGSPVPTRTMDDLARSGVRFETALAPSPETAPSHATLFTGQNPLRHGVTRNGRVLPEEAETLAEVLREHGFATGAFVSSFVMDPRFGWSQGFDVYDARFPRSGSKVALEHAPGFRTLWDGFDIEGGFDRDAVQTTLSARAWLRTAPEPFFLFVHYFDPHDPYQPPEHTHDAVAAARIDTEGRSFPGVSPVEIERLIRAYLGEVQHVDTAIGQLLAELRAKGVAERTLVVLTADHGEGLGQHEWLHHAMHLYREQLRVPLVYAMEGLAAEGARIERAVDLRSVAPTIAALVGAPAPRGATGRSLAETVRTGSEPEPRPIYGYRARRSATQWAAERWSVRSDGLRYIRAADGGEELYDLRSDPLELGNRIHDDPEERAAHAELLDAYLRDRPSPPLDQAITPEARAALEALGYVE